MHEVIQKYQEHLSPPQNRFFKNFTPKLTAAYVETCLSEVLAAVEKCQSPEDWEEALNFWNETKSHISTHFELVQLAYQCFTDDESLEKEERRLQEEVEPVAEEWNAKIRSAFLASPERAYLEKKFGNQFFMVLQIESDAFDPKNIKLETQLSQILSDYTKLTGGAKIEVEGVEYPLAHYRKFANDPDPEKRKASFLSYANWYLDHREPLEKIYDRCTQLRDQMGKTLGYDHFIPLAYQKLRRTDYGPDEVAVFRESIREVLVPLAKQIRQHQAKALGSDQVSIWNSDYFPDWQIKGLKVQIKEQPQTALKVYEKLSPQLGKHFKRMMDWGLIDLEARKGKGPGAFCTDFSDYRVPFIFLNSVGEASDISTMLHETGHSFQAWESSKIDLLELRWPTLEACEVHSMGMEFLAYPYYEEFLSPEDAARYKKKHLAESILIMPYIAMVDEFQHRVYSGEVLGAEGRAQLWDSLEEKYNPLMDFSDCPPWRKHRWIRQLHLFRSPFYYIDYAIALVGAWQVWMQSLADKEEAMNNYLNLCRLGGTLPLKQFFAAGKLRLPFESGMLSELMEQVMAAQPLF